MSSSVAVLVSEILFLIYSKGNDDLLPCWNLSLANLISKLFIIWIILICEHLDLLVVPKIICMDHIYNSYIVQMLTRLFRAALNEENNQDYSPGKR